MSRQWQALAVVMLALFGIACGAARPRALSSTARSDQLQLGKATFVIQYEPVDEASALDVKKVIAGALPHLQRWGDFSEPVTIRIHPTHEALEEAIHHFNYPWLRAWARYDSIDLQSPRTWGVLGSTVNQVAELLTHELTHCLMYQRSATADTWPYKGIPLWFREGMASVTAHQEYRRPHDEDVWRYLNAHPDKNPVLHADSMYQTEPDIVYGAAHQAFDFLDRRYGDEAINRLMERMRNGEKFSPSFRSVIGISEATFSREYLRYVAWEGWRESPAKQEIPKPLVRMAPTAVEGRRPRNGQANQTP
jgi:hypothetical protein